MKTLSSLKNIGMELEKKLRSIGVNSVEEFINIGSEETYAKLKDQYSNICLVHLYALEGAFQNIEINNLSFETKERLKMVDKNLKKVSANQYE